MKAYTTPKLLSICECAKTTESILPSIGAVTGAASMLARSAAKSSAREKTYSRLQKITENEKQHI